MTLGPPPTPGFDEPTQRNLAAHAAAVAAVGTGEAPSHQVLAPEFRIENRASAITDYVYRGAAGWRELMKDLFEEFRGKPRYELEEIIEATGEYVVAAYCICGKAAASGGPLEFHWYGVTWFRDGKAVRSVGFATRDLALSAAYAPQQLAA